MMHALSDADPETVHEFVILGMTHGGKLFRPSDWAERLCGAMSCFQPEGVKGARHGQLQYSHYVRPMMHQGVWSVVVSECLRTIEPLAYHFVMDFAKDNDLQIIEKKQPV